jgi:hypothetical protein
VTACAGLSVMVPAWDVDGRGSPAPISSDAVAARREGCPCPGVPPVSTRYPGGQGSNEMSGKRGDGPSSRWLSWWRRYLSKNAPMYVRSSVMAVFGLMVPRSDVT